MILPPRLKPGDHIGIVSPAWGGAGAFPHRIEQAQRNIHSLGFQVKLAPHALNQKGYVSDTPENRAADIHAMFQDERVGAIVAAIGGDHSCHLLSLLDFDLIRANPKIFMGYSDITVLNVAIWKTTGLVTFNGPAILTDFGEYPQMFDYTKECFLKAVTSTQPIGWVQPASWWTEEFQDWELLEDRKRPRRREPSTGWTWLKTGSNQRQRVEGPLIGGCLSSLEHLRGTPYWPEWQGAIFFFETSEEKPLPQRVDSLLMDYENMGIFEKLNGMLVGRPMKYSLEEKRQLRQVVLQRTHKYDFPILMDMDFGHTAPQFTLPLGCRARIDVQRRRFEIVQAAVI
jgi:muramoyltetrapeptide carboxypeptidase LdcA involved in peptidoglycan recycling